MKRALRSRTAPQGNANRALPRPLVHELELTEVGGRGDALANGENGPLYVPLGLPQELVRASVLGDRGRIIEILRPSPDRVAPACAHFGICGGCALMHWADQGYLDWKREQVVQTLARRGLECEVRPTIAAWGEGRRRATLHIARNAKGQVRMGFMRRASHEVEAITRCEVLSPSLQRAWPLLTMLAQMFAPKRGDAQMALLETRTGIDVQIKGAGSGPVSPDVFQELVRLTDQTSIARIALDQDIALERHPPIMRVGVCDVRPPPGAFFQATQAGEDALAGLVMAAASNGERVVDLFAGLGTFSLRLAQHAEVLAVEGEAAMVAACQKAHAGAPGLKTLQAVKRDLFRAPLAPLELKRFDLAVIDPPRAGARAQVEQLARSRLGQIVMVSCDPGTFARDARMLVDAGFAIGPVTPVDQFRYSPHIELQASFVR